MKLSIIFLLLAISLSSHAEVVSYNLISRGGLISAPAPGLLRKYPVAIDVKACADCSSHNLLVVANSEFYFEDQKLDVEKFFQQVRSFPSKKVRIQFNKYNKKIYFMSLNSRNKDAAL